MDIKVAYIVMKVSLTGVDYQSCIQNTEEEALRWIAAELGNPASDKIQLYIKKVYMRAFE